MNLSTLFLSALPLQLRTQILDQCQDLVGSNFLSCSDFNDHSFSSSLVDADKVVFSKANTFAKRDEATDDLDTSDVYLESVPEVCIPISDTPSSLCDLFSLPATVFFYLKLILPIPKPLLQVINSSHLCIQKHLLRCMQQLLF